MERSKTVTTLLLVVMAAMISSSATAQQQQTCQSYNGFAADRFTSCADLPELSSFLHWSYNSSSGALRMAYRHTGVSATTWVAWGINPAASLEQAMVGAQTVVAVPQSGRAPRVFTSPVSGYNIQTLTEGDLRYPVTGLNATYQNNEMVIFATWTLPAGTTAVNQVWQAGPLSGTTIVSHPMVAANQNSKGRLDLQSGQTQSGGGAGSRLRKRNVHGVLNAVSWGILMPLGAIIARHMRVFKSADPAWFYLHVTCQTSAYIVGVAGWGTGLKLGSDSPGVTHNPHRGIGIALFCLGTLQVFALLLRPKKDHKYRLFWNIYHHAIGYAVIALSIANVYEGFKILNLSDDAWKRAYTGVIIGLGALAVVLEAYTWFYVIKMKKEDKSSYGTNGVNGYGARTHTEV